MSRRFEAAGPLGLAFAQRGERMFGRRDDDSDDDEATIGELAQTPTKGRRPSSMGIVAALHDEPGRTARAGVLFPIRGLPVTHEFGHLGLLHQAVSTTLLGKRENVQGTHFAVRVK